MRIYYTQGTLEYYHPTLHKMITTDNEIPFIVDWDGVLIDEINQYLLFKSELDWKINSNTAKNNAQNILSYLDFCEQYSVNFRQCSGVDIRKYIAYMTSNYQKSSTINVKVSCINSMYQWLFDRKILPVNPFLEFNTKEVSHIVNVFSNKTRERTFNVNSAKQSIAKDIDNIELPTQEELKALYDSLDEETQLMMFILVSTGMRKEELLQLTREMFLNNKSSISGKTYSIILDANKINIKNNKSRIILISDSLRIKILKHLNSNKYKKHLSTYLLKNSNDTINNAPLFISNRGNKFSTDKLNKSFDKACNKLNIKVTPHELRHFYASNFIYQKELSGSCTEQDYMYLAERLGHSSSETTKTFYVKIVNRLKQQEDMEKYSELFVTEFIGGVF